MRAPPSASGRRGEKTELSAGARETSFEDGTRSLRLIDLYIKTKQSDRFKKTNTENQMVFLSPLFFCCHWTRNTVNTPQSQRKSPFLQWHSAARRWNPWTNIRDLFLPERSEQQQFIGIFILLHCFYFPPSVHIVHLPQAV